MERRTPSTANETFAQTMANDWICPIPVEKEGKKSLPCERHTLEFHSLGCDLAMLARELDNTFLVGVDA